MPNRFFFLDTNTFLHHKALDQIDWRSILGLGVRWLRLFGQFSAIFKWKFCFSV
jgi:hypothetical protein